MQAKLKPHARNVENGYALTSVAFAALFDNYI